MEGELRPCPFCGYVPAQANVSGGGPKYWVECYKCEASGPVTDGWANVGREWNHRPGEAASRSLGYVRAQADDRAERDAATARAEAAEQRAEAAEAEVAQLRADRKALASMWLMTLPPGALATVLPADPEAMRLLGGGLLDVTGDDLDTAGLIVYMRDLLARMLAEAKPDAPGGAQ